MRRLVACIAVVAACCGDGRDTAPPVGSWRLVSQTTGGVMTTAVDGWLEVTETEYALGVGKPAPSGAVTTFTVADGALVLAGGASVPFTEDGTSLTLEPTAQVELVFAKATATSTETIPVAGTATLAAGAPALANPRVAMAFLTRSGFTIDPRDDKVLALTGGMAAIDLARTQGALGTERIPIGDRAGIAIGVVVIYDDRDSSGTLDALAKCTGATGDCVRGVSPILLGYRDGTSTELSASPYSFLRTGWSHAVTATDTRTGSPRTGLVSTDTQQQLPHDVTIPVDPTTVQIPSFVL